MVNDSPTPGLEPEAKVPRRGKRTQNLYGQAMGRKGTETRARLMRATLDLLEKRSIRDVSVSEIASLAGTSSSGFYIYFADVTAVALAIAEGVEQITPEIESVLSSRWTAENANDHAIRLVTAYVALWGKHHAILRVRNLAADEGDKRFEDARHRSVLQVRELLEARIAEADNGLDPSAGASAVLALLERLGAIARLPLRRHHSRQSLINAAAFLAASSMMPRNKR